MFKLVNEYGSKISPPLLKRIKKLLSVILIGIGKYEDAYNLIVNNDDEDFTLMKEILELIMGGQRLNVSLNIKSINNKIMRSIINMTNSVNNINCPLLPCENKDTEVILNTICSLIEENKNKMLSCIVPKFILLNEELHNLLFIE